MLVLYSIIENGPVITLPPSAQGVLGRETGVDYLIGDPTVSRRHAMLQSQEDRLLITDLESVNGSFINGVVVGPVLRAANPGDTVQFGSVIFRLERHQTTPTTPGPPVQRPRSATVVAAAGMQRDLKADLLQARRIQYAMIQGPTQVNGYCIRQLYKPARELSGDFIVCTIRGSGELWAMLGDVCGKGLPSAMLMAFVVGAARAVIRRASSPAALLDELGELVQELNLDAMFATATALVLDTQRHRLEIALAGHPAALLRRLDGRVEELGSAPGTALGAAASEQTDARRISLQAGESLILASDGVQECENSVGDPFGDQRLRDLVHSNSSAPTIVEALERELLAHRGQRDWHDDVTALVISRVN